MLTVVIRRNNDPDVTQLTQKSVLRELWQIKGSEILLEDSWMEGLRKVRTPYVCLVEADCTLSASYLTSNFGLMYKTNGEAKNIGTGWGGSHGGGGYTKLAMIASCLGIEAFNNRIYNYELKGVKDEELNGLQLKYSQVRPSLEKRSNGLYHVQIGFVPGAIIRMAALKGDIDKLPWDTKDLVQLSTAVSFHFWNTGRRIQVNPNTTYVSNTARLADPVKFDHKIPDLVRNVFAKDFTLPSNLKGKL